MSKIFKHGDVVSIPFSQKKRILGVVLHVDIDRHPNFIGGHKSGLYVFRGQWYGNSQLNIKSFGKCEGMVYDRLNYPVYKVGHISSFRNTIFY